MSFTITASTRSMALVAVAVWVIFGITWMVILTKKGHDIVHNDCKSRREGAFPAITHSHDSSITHNISTSGKPLGTQSVFNQRLKHYSSLIFKSTRSNHREKCTLVILTYKRVKILADVIKHYCSMNQFQKILIIWNDVSTTVPRSLYDLNQLCSADLKYIQSTQNKLTNRYLPREEIETDCKLVKV